MRHVSQFTMILLSFFIICPSNAMQQDEDDAMYARELAALLTNRREVLFPMPPWLSRFNEKIHKIVIK